MTNKKNKSFKTNASVLFLDIRNFTNLTDLLTPEIIARILNDFFSDIEKIIKENNGEIDKYIGDAVMAVFSGSGHCTNSFIAANKIIKNTSNKKYEDFKLKVGIGIASGDMLSISLVNSPKTVLGSPVNLASRLESLTKEFNANLLIDSTTFDGVREKIKKDYGFFPIDNLTIRGIYHPVTIYITAYKEKKLEKTFLDAVKEFKEGKYENAITAFSEILAKFKRKKIPTQIITNHYLSKALKGIDKTNQFFAEPVSYDNYSKTQFLQANQLLTFMNSIIPEDFRPKNILDIGCGSGSFTKIISDKFKKAKVDGIDVSHQMIEHVKGKFKSGRYSFYELDIGDTNERIRRELHKNKYDLVVSNSALHWVLDQQRAYKNIAEVLADKGWVCVHQGGYGTYEELRMLAEHLLKKEGIQKQIFDRFSYPAKYLKEAELKKILYDSGLEVISMIGKKEKPSPSLPQDFANAGLLPYLEHLNYAEKQWLKDNFIKEAKKIFPNFTIYRLYAIARKKQ